MTFANLTTDPGTDRNSFSCIGVTIADAIDDSKREFPNCYQTPKIAGMTEISDPRVEILKAIVEAAGGPADFARRYSRDDADKPIDATYVSQIINGHRPFRDKARLNMARRAGLADDYFESKAKPDTEPKPGHEVRQERRVYDLIPEIIKAVVEIMKRLEPEDQKKVLAYTQFTETEQNNGSTD